MLSTILLIILILLLVGRFHDGGTTGADMGRAG
jgi:hypothetical protein